MLRLPAFTQGLFHIMDQNRSQEKIPKVFKLPTRASSTASSSLGSGAEVI